MLATARPMQNSGHGWVRPRPDGMLAKCGGPTMCQTCKAEVASTLSDEQRRLAARALKGYILRAMPSAALPADSQLEVAIVAAIVAAGGQHATAPTDDGRRLKAIRALCGYVQDGSHQTFAIGQDDATRDWVVTLDRKFYSYGSTFDQAIDAAIAKAETT